MTLIGSISYGASGTTGSGADTGFQLDDGTAQTGTERTDPNGFSKKTFRELPTATEHATLILGFAVRGPLRWDSPGGSGDYTFASFKSDAAATTHITISTSAGQSFSARRGDGTLLGTSATGLWPATEGTPTWRYVEIMCTLHDS